MPGKALVVYYSRTGNTRKVAETLAEALGAETEEIVAKKPRKGLRGWFFSGAEASRKIPAEIEPAKKDPAAYDLVAIGTPVWAWTVASPVRAYLERHGKDIKQAAFFCTMGSAGAEKTFTAMEELCGKKPLGTLALSAMGMRGEGWRGEARALAEKIGRKPPQNE